VVSENTSGELKDRSPLKEARQLTQQKGHETVRLHEDEMASSSD
jgi:hypothetical protein